MRKLGLHSNLIGAFLLLGGGVAGHVMLETARDTLFLKNLPSSALPWAYLIVAMISGIVVFTVARQQHRINTRKLIAASYFVVSFVTLLFYVLLKLEVLPDAIAFMLYVWVGTYITFLVSSAWLLISTVFPLDEAKKSFGFISAGASIGAIAGSAAAVAIISRLQHADAVLLAAAAVFALTGAVPYLWRMQAVSPARRPMRSAHFFSELRGNGYLRTIAGIALFSTVAVTALDWLFKATVAESVLPDQLGWFFANFYFLTNTAALLTQVFLLQFLFRYLGATHTLYIFAGIVLIGTAFILGTASFYAVISLKFAEATFKNSLHKPAIELLYVPLHDHVRKKFKLALDLFALRGGQALASVIILAGALWIDQRLVAVITIILGFVASLVILSRLKPRYVKLFHDYLREGRIGTALDRPKLDLLSIETILDTLDSERDAEVVAAMEFLQDEDKTPLLPGLILFHPSERVVLTALEIFSAHPRPELKKVALRLLKDPRDRVRVATLRLLMHFDPPEEFLRTVCKSPDSALKATALVGMVMLDYAPKSDCEKLADRLITERDSQGLIDLCQAIEFWGDDRFKVDLTKIYNVDNLEVKRAALVAFAKMPGPESLNMAELAYPTPGLRIEAEHALVAGGPEGFHRLISMLNSEEFGHDVRIAVPASLGKFDFPEVQERLLKALDETRDGAIAFKLLRVLGRKRSQAPDAPLQTHLLDRFVDDGLRRLGEYLVIAQELAGPREEMKNTIFDMLFDLIADRAEESLERLFRVYDLRYPDGDFEQMYHVLVTGGRYQRANAEELLIHKVNASQARKVVQAIVELSSLRKGTATHDEPTPSSSTGLNKFVREHRRIFRQLLKDDSATIRALTAYLIGSSGAIELTGDIHSAARSESEAINEAFTIAIENLEQSGSRAIEQ